MNPQRAEVEQMMNGATASLETARFLATAKDAPASSVTKAYDLAADGINAVTRAFWRNSGKIYDPRVDSQVKTMRMIIRDLSRVRVPNLPDEDDLAVIIEARNGSVHTGAASATSIEQSNHAIRLATQYFEAIRKVINNSGR